VDLGALAGGAFVALVPLLFGVFVVIAFFYERRLRERHRAFATAIGWDYAPRAPHLVGRWQGAPFDVGHSKRVTHLFTGDFEGRPAACFQYQYTTGSGKSSSTTVLTVCMLHLPAALPVLEITREGLGARIAKVFGAQDVQFESEEFNRRWRVAGSSPRTTHDLVHPRAMEYLNAGPDDPLRIEGADVWTWHHGGIRTEALHGRLARLAGFVDLVPRHVWLDHGYDPGTGAARAPGKE